MRDENKDKKMFSDEFLEFYDRQFEYLNSIKSDLEKRKLEYIKSISVFKSIKETDNIKERNRLLYEFDHNWRFFWLNWITLEFHNDILEYTWPYKGLQIYLYSVAEDEIGKSDEDSIESSRLVQGEKAIENEISAHGSFKYDKKSYYQIGKNLDIDTSTGNLIKYDISCNYAQIWFYQDGGHKGIKANGLCDKNISEFCRTISLKGEKDYDLIKMYYNSLLDERLVSKEIKSDNYDEIAKEIKSMIENCINKHK